jgi:hypothetical protein
VSPSAICVRQEKPSARTNVSGSASRTAGRDALAAGDREVVVARFEAEVAGQAAAARVERARFQVGARRISSCSASNPMTAYWWQ